MSIIEIKYNRHYNIFVHLGPPHINYYYYVGLYIVHNNINITDNYYMASIKFSTLYIWCSKFEPRALTMEF